MITLQFYEVIYVMVFHKLFNRHRNIVLVNEIGIDMRKKERSIHVCNCTATAVEYVHIFVVGMESCLFRSDAHSP